MKSYTNIHKNLCDTGMTAFGLINHCYLGCDAQNLFFVKRKVYVCLTKILDRVFINWDYGTFTLFICHYTAFFYTVVFYCMLNCVPVLCACDVDYKWIIFII